MANLLSLFLFLACLLLIISGIDRGFDISDEGLYMLLSVPSQENESGIINYDLFFKLLFQLSGYSFSIVELRLMRLVGYFLAALALTKFLKSRFETSLTKSQVFLLSILGLFSGYAFLPPTLSYNSLVVVLSCFWLFNTFSNQLILQKSLLQGVILALLVYVKITVALVLFLVSIAFWVKKKQFSFRSFGLLFVPFLIVEGVFWIFLGDFASARLFGAIPITSSRPTYELIPLIKSPLVGFVFALFGLLVGGLISRVKGQSYPFLAFILVFALGLFFLLVRFTHITEEWNHVVMLATSVFLGFLWVNSKSEWSCSLEEITLFFLPFLLHLGSNVYWLRIGIHYWVFWILLVLIYSVHYPKTVLNSVSVLAFLLVFNGIWWHPFGHDKPLWSAKVEFEMGGQKFKVDKELVDAVIQIRDFAEVRGVSQIHTAYRVPGLIWLSGYQIPHSAGVWDKIQLESISMSPPNELVFCQHDVLPEGWNFPHTKTLGSIQGHPPIYLLWK